MPNVFSITRSLALAGAALASLRGAAPHTSPSSHDLHLSHTRMVVDGTTIRCRVRLFKDDLELALRRHASSPALAIDASPSADSVFTSYWNAHVVLTSNGVRLSGKVVESGRDPEATDPAMWWYQVELRAPTPIHALSMRIALLFEQFKDQRNVVTLVRMPGEERHSLYFEASDRGMRTLRF